MRIELIPLTRQDIELFTVINTNPHVRKFLWDDMVVPAETLAEILEKVETRFVNDAWRLWKIRLLTTGTIIGYAGLWIFFNEQRPQLLYALLPEHTGKGYATEASKLVTDHALRVLGFPELVASMDRDNMASRSVCERLGFQFEGERIMEGKPTAFYKMKRADLYLQFLVP